MIHSSGEAEGRRGADASKSPRALSQPRGLPALRRARRSGAGIPGTRGGRVGGSTPCGCCAGIEGDVANTCVCKYGSVITPGKQRCDCFLAPLPLLILAARRAAAAHSALLPRGGTLRAAPLTPGLLLALLGWGLPPLPRVFPVKRRPPPGAGWG